MSDRINKVLTTLNSNTITDVAHKSMVSHTPIKTGNARRNTVRQGTQIKADYPYADRLEDNYSPQTHGKGIIQPTLEDVRDYVFKKTGINIKL
jgi:hypothetical protein